ncbi:cyclic nucleotide-binding domain-containing protein [Myxococcus sp. Y35]|uniref:cyclic nucleotide-binding domain-containing protein n=1 Tax=Pseudomyxococcus flavus TaxID=3115648 RepID=UPI003CF1E83D
MELRKLKDKASEAFSKGRFSKAAELYEDYCRAEPKDHQSRLRTGDAWVKAGQKDRAISSYQAAAEGFAREGFLPRAIAASKLILELDPAHRGVQQMLADLYAQRGTPMGPRARGPLSQASSVTARPVVSEGAAQPAAATGAFASGGPLVGGLPSVLPTAPEASFNSGGPLGGGMSSVLPTAPEAPFNSGGPLGGGASPGRPSEPEAGRVGTLQVEAGSPVPDALEAEGAAIDLSAELPPELAVSMATGTAVSGAEEVIHSVHVGLASEEGGPALELTLDVEPPAAGMSAGAAPGADVTTSTRTNSALQATASEVVDGTASGPSPTRMAVAEPVNAPNATRMAAKPPLAPHLGSSNPVVPPVSTRMVGGEIEHAPGTTRMATGEQLSPPGVPRAADAEAERPPNATHMATAEAVSPPLATRMSAVQPGGARPATSALPPGLAPRSSQRLPAVASSGRSVSNSGRWQALAAPISTPTSEPSAALPDSRMQPSEPQPAAGATAIPGHDLTSALGASIRTSASVSAFTELELEADSLLHAVELAAQAGLGRQWAATGDVEEEVFSLTEEVSPDATSLETLPTIPLFSDLPRDAFIALFERCPLRRFGPGERIIEQGSRGDAFYVICEGAVRVFRTEEGQRQPLATLEGGAFFGEMALLSGAPRTASVESASDDTQLLEISAGVLAELSRGHPQVAQALKKFCRQRMLTNVMNTSELFRLFDRKDRRALVERFRSRDVERDTVIIRDGDPTDGLYVVLSGEVEVRKDGHLLTLLREGEVFGEISLLQKTPATATVTATRHTTLLRLPRADFDALISSHPQILALISDLSDERLRRTQRVLSEAGVEEDIILV